MSDRRRNPSGIRRYQVVMVSISNEDRILIYGDRKAHWLKLSGSETGWSFRDWIYFATVLAKLRPPREPRFQSKHPCCTIRSNFQFSRTGNSLRWSQRCIEVGESLLVSTRAGRITPKLEFLELIESFLKHGLLAPKTYQGKVLQTKLMYPV